MERLLRVLLRHRHRVALGVVLVALAVVYVVNQEHGVDWGDDFALYLHQARGIVDGNAGAVIAGNKFTLAHSSWSTFSPDAYPWGWPLLLAPFVWLFGLNYNVLKLLEVAALCCMLGCYWRVVARRAGRPAAWLLFGLVAFSPLYMASADTVLSDLPFAAAVFGTLVLLDRARAPSLLAAPVRDLVLVGLLMGLAFNIRREGLALLAAVVAAQGADLLRHPRPRLSRPVLGRLATPYGAAAGLCVVIVVALPGPLFQRVAGAGIGNIRGHLPYYGDVLGEAVSLKAAGGGWALLGSSSLAQWFATVVVALAVAGLVARLVRDFTVEVPVAAYLLSVSFLILATPAQEPRYALTVIPLLAYYAYQAFPAMAANATDRAMVRRAATVGAVAILGVLLVVNARATYHATRYHLTYRYTNPGPSTTVAQQMFREVRARTAPDAVVAFFRARAMSLYTDRRALQLTQLDQISERADWYAMVKDSDYSQALVTDDQAAAAGWTKAWENASFVLWRVRPA